MKAAWDKLRGPSGKLGAPVGDQAVDGDVVSQKFTGGKISWNRAKNSFTTDPANLAPLLSGLQVPGQNQPSTSAMPAHAKEFAWHWWYLLAIIPLLVLVALLGFVAFGWRRRRRAARGLDREDGREDGAYNPDRDVDGGYELAADGRWVHDDAESAARISWSRAGVDDGAPEDFGLDDEDPDAVDTTTIPVVSEHDLAEAGAAADGIYPDQDYGDDDYPDDGYPDEDYRDVAVPRTPPDAGYAEGADAPYRDLAVPHTAPDPDAFASDSEARAGRHAAFEADDAAEFANAEPVPARRPTIHPPLDDPYQAPDGYPIKASARFGLYYTPSSVLYDDTIAEFWLSSEEVARANGFIKAD
jgi:uncharacterized protein with LGFP repeats